MTHPDRRQIQHHLDGLLAAAEDRHVAIHLTECDTCRQIAAHEGQLREVLRTLALETPSDQFERRVLDAVLPRAAREKRDRQAIRRYGWVIGLCMLSLAVFLLAGQRASDTPSILRPAFDSVETWLAPAHTRITALARDAFGERRPGRAEGNNILEVLVLALSGLAAFYMLDRLISPHMKRGRLP